MALPLGNGAGLVLLDALLSAPRGTHGAMTKSWLTPQLARREILFPPVFLLSMKFRLERTWFFSSIVTNLQRCSARFVRRFVLLRGLVYA